ncbi:MAG: carboxypeptidase [Bacteroidota bacterium]|nr:carboxypeptidase [Bacteroidota bacterium]
MRKIVFVFFFSFVYIIHSFAQLPLFEMPDSLTQKAYKAVTHHSIKIGGGIVSYTATAGTMILKNERDSAIAIFGYTAYTRDGYPDASKRPVTFAYNGGPGSSSMWLHMGALGPRRVVVNDPEPNGPPPYTVEDNANSIIDVTDLVMIDPVGTGLSHAINKSTNKDYWGVDEDIKSMSQFIKQYVTDNSRWNSPKYLLGESYGTFRSAGIADYLLENMGIAVNGVVLVSVVLDLRTLTFQDGDDISYMLHLPSYAAVAWYHNRIANKPANLESFVNEVRTYAMGDYAAALAKGSSLSDAEKGAVAAKLSSYTGLSKDYLLKGNIRINEPQFTEELLRDSSQVAGRLDARYKGINEDLLGEFAYTDPQSDQISPPYTAAFLSYYYDELKVNKSLNYHTSAYSAEGFRWNWSRGGRGSGDATTPNTAVDLARAMSRNPSLKILVLNGYFDLATPFFATEYTFHHMGLEKRLQQNVTMKYYEAGHMMYIKPSVIPEFKKDIAAFMSSTSK